MKKYKLTVEQGYDPKETLAELNRHGRVYEKYGEHLFEMTDTFNDIGGLIAAYGLSRMVTFEEVYKHIGMNDFRYRFIRIMSEGIDAGDIEFDKKNLQKAHFVFDYVDGELRYFLFNITEVLDITPQRYLDRIEQEWQSLLKNPQGT